MGLGPKFYKSNPDIWPQPSLREQIEALEQVSGETAYMSGGFLYIDVKTDTNRKVNIKYILTNKTDPRTGEVRWVLEHDGKWHLIEDILKRPELLEILVTLKQTKYRGVVLDSETYWTSNSDDLEQLHHAVTQLKFARSHLEALIGE